MIRTRQREHRLGLPPEPLFRVVGRVHGAPPFRNAVQTNPLTTARFGRSKEAKVVLYLPGEQVG
jgi:hypothetical protein